MVHPRFEAPARRHRGGARWKGRTLVDSPSQRGVRGYRMRRHRSRQEGPGGARSRRGGQARAAAPEHTARRTRDRPGDPAIGGTVCRCPEPAVQAASQVAARSTRRTRRAPQCSHGCVPPRGRPRVAPGGRTAVALGHFQHASHEPALCHGARGTQGRQHRDKTPLRGPRQALAPRAGPRDVEVRRQGPKAGRGRRAGMTCASPRPTRPQERGAPNRTAAPGAARYATTGRATAWIRRSCRALRDQRAVFAAARGVASQYA